MSLRDTLTTPRLMQHVVVALIPGVVVSTYFYGYEQLVLVATCVMGAVMSELACTRRFADLSDTSAIVTGLLIALCLPVATPWFIGLIAVVIAIALAKHAFGGLGQNVFNPAMAGYAVVLVGFPSLVLEFDAVSGATALDKLAHRQGLTIAEITQDAAFGTLGAEKHEWLNAAYFVGGLYLLGLRVISWHMPMFMILGMGTIALFLDDGGSSLSHGSPLFNWFAGGTMLAAFFIVTDPTTSPSNRWGASLYAFGIGAIAMLIRKFSSWPDGLAFAVLLANCFVPLLNRPKSIR